mgnify:CR=1 FL=1
MSIRDSRSGASQAIYNSNAASFFAAEAMLVGIGYGFFKSSWLEGLLAFVIFAGMIYIPIINYLFAAVMTGAWGYATWILSNIFGNEEMTLVLTILATALSGAIHFYSIIYYTDLTKSD